MSVDANEYPVRSKKPAHTSSNNTVGNFRDFAVVQVTKSVNPPPVWDDIVEPPLAPAVGPHPLPCLKCGTYEVSEPGGSVIPIRVRRRSDTSKFAPDQWVMEWLLGHDGHTWEPFAFVRPDGVEVWKRFRTQIYGAVADRLHKHLTDGECFDGWEFRLAKPCCARCGRELKKEPEATAGIHQTCLEKWGRPAAEVEF